ncbi:hypothetical protein BBP40_003339 [Aspergillus hancockii]|nr:hypothetical protein BBP40_003339 [Aspergillus hancockii]
MQRRRKVVQAAAEHQKGSFDHASTGRRLPSTIEANIMFARFRIGAADKGPVYIESDGHPPGRCYQNPTYQRFACDTCREKKLKCTGQKDGCDRCQSKGLACSYLSCRVHKHKGRRRVGKAIDEARPRYPEKLPRQSGASGVSCGKGAWNPPHGPQAQGVPLAPREWRIHGGCTSDGQRDAVNGVVDTFKHHDPANTDAGSIVVVPDGLNTLSAEHDWDSGIGSARFGGATLLGSDPPASAAMEDWNLLKDAPYVTSDRSPDSDTFTAGIVDIDWLMGLHPLLGETLGQREGLENPSVATPKVGMTASSALPTLSSGTQSEYCPTSAELRSLTMSPSSASRDEMSPGSGRPPPGTIDSPFGLYNKAEMASSSSSASHASAIARCLCMQQILSLNEDVEIATSKGTGFECVDHFFRFQSDVLGQCNRILECLACQGASAMTILLITVCDRLLRSFQAISAAAVDKLRSQLSVTEGMGMPSAECSPFLQRDNTTAPDGDHGGNCVDGADAEAHLQLRGNQNVYIGQYGVQPSPDQYCIVLTVIILELRPWRHLVSRLEKTAIEAGWDTHRSRACSSSAQIQQTMTWLTTVTESYINRV